MWKLFATVLAISDTGSVSVSSIATDFVSPQACEQARQLYPESIDRDINGHRISFRASTVCRSDGGGPPMPHVTIPLPFFR